MVAGRFDSAPPFRVIRTIGDPHYMELNEVRPLLTLSNAKTTKGEKLGFLTGVTYLIPAKGAGGPTLCQFAEAAGCVKPCLVSAGRGAFDNVYQGRLRRTLLFLQNRELFLQAVVRDVQKIIRKAEKEGSAPLVRLNGTSDIRWEKFPVTVGGVTYSNIFRAFPDVQFYDYTKNPYRWSAYTDPEGWPTNYDLTFSYSGKPEFKKYVDVAIEQGMRIAVVFRHRDQIPAEFMGMTVVDGDDTDVRHIEPQGVVVALYAKGAAKQDRSGFVVG
jgi:hypothetical protein